MAQTANRTVIRRNIKLVGGKHLIFDKNGDVWRVAFWRPRRENEDANPLTQELQEAMERAAMLPKMPRNFWHRTAYKTPTLSSGIFAALDNSGYPHLFRDIIHYIESTEWAWYLETN